MNLIFRYCKFIINTRFIIIVGFLGNSLSLTFHLFLGRAFFLHNLYRELNIINVRNPVGIQQQYIFSPTKKHSLLGVLPILYKGVIPCLFF